MKTIYEKWLERVSYDIETAEAMYKSSRYIYVLFMCQQSLEKCFKAFMAFKGMEIIPLHNLRRLTEISGILNEMSKEDMEKIDFLSHYYLNARYKEDIEELVKQITNDKASEFLVFTKEKIKWLTLKMRL